MFYILNIKYENFKILKAGISDIKSKIKKFNSGLEKESLIIGA